MIIIEKKFMLVNVKLEDGPPARRYGMHDITWHYNESSKLSI